MLLSACGGSAAPSNPGGPIRAISTDPSATALASKSVAAAPSTAPLTAAPTAIPPTDTPTTVPTPTATPVATLKLGLSAPFTGAASAFGQEMLRGAETAADEVNATGGVLGKQLVIDQGDDKADPLAAAAAAQKLIGDGAIGVVGPATSAAAIAASTVYEQAGMPMISPTANDPKLTDRGQRFVFRATGRWDQEPALIADYLLRTAKKSKIAIVADPSNYGQLMATGLKQALAASNMTPVLNETIDPTTREFGPLATRIKAAGADGLFYGGYFNDAGNLVKQLGAAGLQLQVTSDDAVQDQGFVSQAGDAGNGTVLPSAPDLASVGSTTTFLANYKRAYGINASIYAVATYDSVKLLADAVNRAGSTNGEAIRQALSSTSTFSGIYLGKVSFDSKGDLQGKPWVLWSVQGGKFQQMPQ